MMSSIVIRNMNRALGVFFFIVVSWINQLPAKSSNNENSTTKLEWMATTLPIRLERQENNRHDKNNNYGFGEMDKKEEMVKSHLIYESSECKYRPLEYIQCKISAVDKYMNVQVERMVKEDKVSLIEYSFYFSNYTPNPFHFNATYFHKPHIWSRTSTTYGQTLLSLAFNYGILSLMTLTAETTKLQVELADNPDGCFGDLSETDRVATVRELLMHDFASVDLNLDEQNKTSSSDVVRNGARICHEVVENDNGYAKFTDCCCYANAYSGEKVCSNSSENTCLAFLYTLLSGVRYCIFIFGPLLFFSTITSLTPDKYPYVVELKEKPTGNVYICRTNEKAPTFKSFHVFDFRGNYTEFKKALEKNSASIDRNDSVALIPPELEAFSSNIVPKTIEISKYHILVDYKRLVNEHFSIGFWKTIFNMIFRCGLKDVDPFRECCRKRIIKNRPWLHFWKPVSSILLIMITPLLYYLRVLVFYSFEMEEIMSRKQIISNLNLLERFDISLLHYFLPNHVLFLFIYIIYALTAVCIVARSGGSNNKTFERLLVGSFIDLQKLSCVDVLHVIVSNIIWPFNRYKMWGFVIAIFFWPIVIPFSLIVFFLYCLPTPFLTTRIIAHAFDKQDPQTKHSGYRINTKSIELNYLYVESMIKSKIKSKKSEQNNVGDCKSKNKYEKFELNNVDEHSDIDYVDHVILLEQKNASISTDKSNNGDNSNSSNEDSTKTKIIDNKEARKASIFKCCFNCLKRILALLACLVILYSMLIIVMECLGFLVDMFIFTMMGIIVNAGSLLKYIALIIMIVVYSYDSFNNVEKKYLQLNKALFTEVKSRVKDLDKITSLPSHLQENRGFKSQEKSEQANHEKPDDVYKHLSHHWFINDLILFVDNEDVPRIPKKLFELVCEIKVPGVPGPIYRGLLSALKQFLKIVIFIIFVFLVVLTFGNVYEISNTNQMLATVAGGSLPLLLKTFIKPESSDIDTSTVSFKSKLNEVISNFAQVWPMHDFNFDLENNGAAANTNKSLLARNSKVSSNDCQQQKPNEIRLNGPMLSRLSRLEEKNVDSGGLLILIPENL